MLRRRLMSADRGVLVLLIIFLVGFPLLFKPWIHGTDPTGYYSWLRSIVIDGDLDTTNEYVHLGQGAVGGTTATGHRDNPYAIGSAILWSPFFLAAHGLTLAVRQLGGAWLADGFGLQYVVAISLGSAVYGWVSVLLTYRLVRDLFSWPVATLASASIWLASPLVFYQYSHPAMSHANDAFAYALFLFTWYRTRQQRSPAQYGLLGLTAGLCALVRYQNAVFVLFPLAEIAFSAVAESGRGEGWNRALRHGVLRGGAFSAAWWLTFLPQLLVWHTVFSSWLPGNPYARSGGGSFDFLHPRLFGVLLSTNHGLFVWTPLILLAVLGWVFLWRDDRRLTALLVFNFGIQVYMIASWSAWSGAAAFGQRFFVNLVPAFGLGLAALLTILHRSIRWRWLVAGCSCFIIWNGLLVVRYVLDDIPHSGPVPLAVLVVGQFTVLWRHFHRIVQILLIRS